MTSIATYSARGRWALWGLASANMYRELTDGDDDYLNDVVSIVAWAGATGALVMPEVGSYLVGRMLSAGASGAGRFAWWLAPKAGAVATVAAPFTAGYLIGATVGTVIAQKVWGDEGAQVALGAYSFGLLPGTQAADLSDLQYIFKPTAPGGPVSLYDVAEAGFKNTLRAVDKFLTNRPYTYRHPSPYMM